MASVAVGLIVGAAASYMLGLWDRLKYSTGILLEAGGEENTKREWFAVVAKCTEKNVGKHVMRLIDGTRKGIESLSDGSELLQEGCKAYLWNDSKEEMPDSLCIGLFFDDPSKVENPRWAIGWAVRGTSDITLEHMQVKLQEQVQKNSGLNKDENEIRVIRLAGETPIFRGKVPWRTTITPALAPMLHWKRTHEEFHKGGYKCDSEEGPVAMEIYVMKKKWFSSYIDYIVTFGDNSSIWKDTFP